MRHCKIYDEVLIGRITLRHYFLMIKSIKLSLTDKERDLHALAWLNIQAKATKQRGKKTVPYFNSFDEFFKRPEEKKGASLNDNNSALKEMVLMSNMKGLL